MNQILSVDMHEKKSKNKKVGTKTIVTFFSIVIEDEIV